VNTLLFGQKAKHVKTQVNQNELVSLNSSPEMEKAGRDIARLKHKLREYENMIDKLKQTNSSSESSLDNTKDKLLVDQLGFLKLRINQMAQELEDKEQTIQQIEKEKGEYGRKYETLEFLHIELQEKNKQLS